MNKNQLNIGSKIRKLRKIRGITLEKLSEDTGMSYSYLSELENNKHSISINNLQKLASYFGIDLIQFLENEETTSLVIRKKDRCNDLVTDDGVIFHIVTAEDTKHLSVMFATLPPNTPKKEHRNIHKHPQGEEFILVTKGEVTVVVEEEKYVLKVGDSIIFPSEKEHVIYAGSKGGEIVLVGAPPYRHISKMTDGK